MYTLVVYNLGNGIVKVVNFVNKSPDTPYGKLMAKEDAQRMAKDIIHNGVMYKEFEEEVYLSPHMIKEVRIREEHDF